MQSAPERQSFKLLIKNLQVSTKFGSSLKWNFRRVVALKAAFAVCLFHLLNPEEVTDGVVTVFVKIIAGGILCKTAANLC